jgi:DNA-binding transcriptional ArsR family regulator
MIQIADLVLDFLKVTAWPAVALIAIFVLKGYLPGLLKASTVSIELFGVTVETSIEKLKSALIATMGGTLSREQWSLLEEIHRGGAVSVAEKGYSMSLDTDLAWIRPLRNAGLVVTLPDGYYIEQAEFLDLSPLGRLLMDVRSGGELGPSSS